MRVTSLRYSKCRRRAAAVRITCKIAYKAYHGRRMDGLPFLGVFCKTISAAHRHSSLTIRRTSQILSASVFVVGYVLRLDDESWRSIGLEPCVRYGSLPRLLVNGLWWRYEKGNPIGFWVFWPRLSTNHGSGLIR